MKSTVKYLGLSVLAILMICYSCKKETDEVVLFNKVGNNVSDEPQPTSAIIGTRLYDFPGGGRKYAVSYSIGSKIYMGFGFKNSGQVVDFWELDCGKANSDSELITKNLWTRLPDFPGSFSKNGVTEGTPLGFAANGKGYVLPGAFMENGNLVNEFWEFDPETSLWAQKANPPFNARYWTAGFSIGTKIYFGAGETYDNGQLQQYRDFWEWDQTTDKWKQIGYTPGPARAHAIGFTIGNKGYFGMGGESGMGGGPLYYDFWEYDPVTNKWSQKADFPGAQQMDAVAFSIGNTGYVTAGWDRMSESTSSQDIWKWDQTTDTWTKIGEFAGTVRTGAVGGTIGKWGYLLSGESLTSFSMLNDFWLIDNTSL